MSEKSEKAKELFLSGYNCAQAVVAVFCEDYGINKNIAFGLTAGFGRGMMSGEICGAVSGAVTVIGMKNTAVCNDLQSVKEQTASDTKKFIKSFKEKYEFLSCKELNKQGRKTCAELVGFAVELLEKNIFCIL